MRPEWETAYLAAILCLNTTARGCELKGLTWGDVDLFDRTLTVRKSKTAAGVRAIPLTGRRPCSAPHASTVSGGNRSALWSRSITSLLSYGTRMTFNDTEIVGSKMVAFNPKKQVDSWRTAWRTLTKKAGLPGFRFHDLRHCAITSLAESGASDSTIMAIAGHVSRRMLERYSHVRMEAKRKAVESLSKGTGMGSYDTNHDTKSENMNVRPVVRNSLITKRTDGSESAQKHAF